MVTSTPDDSALHLLEWGWAHRNRDRPGALEAAQLHLEALPAEAGVLYGYLRWRAGEHQRAITFITESIRLLRAREPGVWLARALNTFGCIAGHLNDRDLALELFKEQLSLARALNCAPLIASALHDSSVQLRFSAPTESQRLLDEARAVYDTFEGDLGPVLVRLNAGHLAADRGDVEGALACYTAALAQPFITAQPLIEAHTLNGILACELRLNNEVAAARIKDQLRRLMDAAPQADVVAECLIGLTEGMPAQQVLRTAESHLELIRSLGTFYRLPVLYHRLSQSYGALGQSLESLRLLTYALSCEQRLLSDQLTLADYSASALHLLEQTSGRIRLLEQRLAATRRANRRLHEGSQFDAESGVRNRVSFIRLADRLAERRPLQFALIHLDHSEKVRAQVGSGAATEVLQRVVTLAQDLAEPGDFLGRVGDAALALARPGPEDLTMWSSQFIRHLRREAWPFLPGNLRPSVSIGVSTAQRAPLEEHWAIAERRLVAVRKMMGDSVVAWG